MADPARRTTVVAVTLAAAGLCAIGLAWLGAAATESVPEQVAFLASGGLGGLALLGTGLAALAVQRRRYEEAIDRVTFARVATDVTEIAELIARRVEKARETRP